MNGGKRHETEKTRGFKKCTYKICYRYNGMIVELSAYAVLSATRANYQEAKDTIKNGGNQMSFAQRHSKGSKFTWSLPTDQEPTFKKLADFPIGAKIRIVAVYINKKGKYNPHPVFISDMGEYIDIPAGNIDDANAILTSDEDIKDINDGKVGIQTEKYISKKYGEQVGFKFIDF